MLPDRVVICVSCHTEPAAEEASVSSHEHRRGARLRGGDAVIDRTVTTSELASITQDRLLVELVHEVRVCRHLLLSRIPHAGGDDVEADQRNAQSTREHVLLLIFKLMRKLDRIAVKTILIVECGSRYQRLLPTPLSFLLP